MYRRYEATTSGLDPEAEADDNDTLARFKTLMKFLYVLVCVTKRYTVTVPDEDGEWLDGQPHLSPSGLLQKAIQEQRQKEESDQL